MKPSLLALCVFVGGCALTEKAPPVEIRYFTPLPSTADERPRTRERPVELRMGRITSSAHLRSRISYRKTNYEIGTYETLRWSDLPESYMRRALHHALFEKRAFVETTSGPAPVIDIELVAFEEVRKPDGPYGVVALHYSLRDEHRVLADGHLEVERKASGSAGFQSIIVAVSGALGSVADQTADQLARGLEAASPPH